MISSLKEKNEITMAELMNYFPWALDKLSNKSPRAIDPIKE